MAQEKFTKITFKKSECAEIAKLIRILRDNIPAKKRNDTSFFANIMAPAYDWLVFFTDASKE